MDSNRKTCRSMEHTGRSRSSSASRRTCRSGSSVEFQEASRARRSSMERRVVASDPWHRQRRGERANGHRRTDEESCRCRMGLGLEKVRLVAHRFPSRPSPDRGLLLYDGLASARQSKSVAGLPSVETESAASNASAETRGEHGLRGRQCAALSAPLADVGPTSQQTDLAAQLADRLSMIG